VNRLFNFLFNKKNPHLNNTIMSDQSDKIIIHSTSDGKLYVKDSEFFTNKKVQSMIFRLLKSKLYKNLKNSPKHQLPA
jgi:hypothetical protein